MIVQANMRHSVPLADDSVQCCVTSPPYWGIRDYGFPEQIGLEPTPEDYVASLVSVFSEVKRVLRPDGTLWLNIGDSSYNYRPGTYEDNRAHSFGEERNRFRGLPKDPSQSHRGRKIPGLKNKDLVGIPWMTAFALRATGWYLRAEIIWAKVNPMPESVKDRPTRSHEQLFLLSKKPKYYYDWQAILEPVTGGARPRGKKPNPKSADIGRESGVKANSSFSDSIRGLVEERMCRDVWFIASESGECPDHFAIFPQALVKRCLLAGTKMGDIALDSFGGTGTVSAVASQLGREAVCFDMKDTYLKFAADREKQPRNRQGALC